VNPEKQKLWIDFRPYTNGNTIVGDIAFYRSRGGGDDRGSLALHRAERVRTKVCRGGGGYWRR